MQLYKVVCGKPDRAKLSVAVSRINFENETAVSETPVAKVQVMWDMTLRRLLSSYGRFEGLQCFRLLDKAVDASKRRKMRIVRHSITSHKNWILSNTNVRNSDFVYCAFVLCALSHVLPEEGDAECPRNSGFKALLENCEKDFYSSYVLVYVSVHRHGITRHPLDGFSWNFIFHCFRKSVEKIQVLLKSDKNNGYFTWRFMYFMIISRWIFNRMWSFSDKSCRECKKKNPLTFSNFLPENPCRWWDSVEKYDRARHATDDNIILCMHTACWLTKATDTVGICNT